MQFVTREELEASLDEIRDRLTELEFQGDANEEEKPRESLKKKRAVKK